MICSSGLVNDVRVILTTSAAILTIMIVRNQRKPCNEAESAACQIGLLLDDRRPKPSDHTEPDPQLLGPWYPGVEFTRTVNGQPVTFVRREDGEVPADRVSGHGRSQERGEASEGTACLEASTASEFNLLSLKWRVPPQTQHREQQGPSPSFLGA